MPCPICDQKPANCDCTETERRQYAEIQELKDRQWISVEERQPEAGIDVLVFLPKQSDINGGVYVARLSSLEFLEGTFSTHFGFGFEATHWMPLPEPPEDA